MRLRFHSPRAFGNGRACCPTVLNAPAVSFPRGTTSRLGRGFENGRWKVSDMAARSEQARPLLEVAGLTKSFLGQRALDGVDFKLRAGEIHALLGENGAGKSTLIKAVTGVVQRGAGTVRLDGGEMMPRHS